jgi:hypothetical protein
MLTCLFAVLFTFYIQGVLKLKNNNSGAKGLILEKERIVRMDVDNYEDFFFGLRRCGFGVYSRRFEGP